jgi:hypothetical protein
MKMLRFYIIIMWLLAAAVTATAQGRGVAEGRLVNRTDPAIAAGNTELEVLLLSGGMDIIKTAATDARGTFRIDDLPDAMPLMLRAVYKGANYHGMLMFDTDGKARMELDVYEPTASMKDISVEEASMAFQLEGEYLHAVETFILINNADPPKVYLNPGGNFRISKAQGILEPPQFRITAPGSEMPLTQSALESADGESYYSLYPLRPGITSFEVHQTLPYTDGKYVYVKKFFQDIPEFPIGVMPIDMAFSGGDLEKIEEHAEENFAVYAAGAVKADDAVTWTFTGGTPVMIMDSEHGLGETAIEARDGIIGRNALPIGSVIFMVFILALWFSCRGVSRNAPVRPV